LNRAIILYCMEAVELFKKAVELEEENVRKLREGTGKLRNIIIKELLGSIANDSQKHAELYRGLIRYLTEVGAALSEENFEELQRIVEEHIRMEEEMIKYVNEMLEREDLPKEVRYVLDYILVDERRHHALLKGMLEVIVRKKVITEKDWWDLIWKDVPFHGTPGG